MKHEAEDVFLERVGTFLDRWPASVVKALALISIPFFGLLDYLSVPEVAFSVFCLIPLSVLAWVGDGDDRAIVAWACVLAALSWLLADLAAGAEYEQVSIAMWNLATRLAIFLILTRLLVNLRQSVAEAHRLARVDHLTGIANSRTFQIEVKREVARSQRTGRAISLAYLDVDDFKSINDTQGHAGGDRVLRHLAIALHLSTRSTDLVGRVGGDEFAVLLPETGPEDAASAIKALDTRVAERTADLGSRVSFSLGCVTFMRAPADADELLQAADELMYAAKGAGKNKSNLRVIDQVVRAEG